MTKVIFSLPWKHLRSMSLGSQAESNLIMSSDSIGSSTSESDWNNLESSFLPRDPKFQEVLEQGGENPSIKVDKWALNRLSKFRAFIRVDQLPELVDMPLPDAAGLLCRFFEQVKKKNGELYPPESIMGLMRAFNRIYCKTQQSRVLRTGVDEAQFAMTKSPLFKRVCVACVLSMKRTKEAGLGGTRKKASVVSMEDEQSILASNFMAKTNARGLLRRTTHYCLFRFGIRGGNELRNLLAGDFVIAEDDKGKSVCYDERMSKNYRIMIKKYQTEHFRPALNCYESDVVVTFEKYFAHRPPDMKEMFLTPIDNPRGKYWYARRPVGAKQLSRLVKNSHTEVGISYNGGTSSSLTNKSGRSSLITRMAEPGVPPNIGMLIFGHKSEGAYKRYDRSQEMCMRAAQSCIEGNISYNEAIEEEKKKLRVNVIDGRQDKENQLESFKRLKISDGDVTVKKSVATESTLTGLVAVGPNSDGDQMTCSKVQQGALQDISNYTTHCDWEAGRKFLEKGKSPAQSSSNAPMNALFGNMANCSVNITFSGSTNVGRESGNK